MVRCALPLALLLLLASPGSALAQEEPEAPVSETAGPPVTEPRAPEKGLSSFAAALAGSLKAPPMPMTSFFAPGRLWKRLGIDSRPSRGEWAEYEMLESGVAVGKLKISILPGTSPKNLIMEIRTLTVGGPSYVKLLLRGGLDQPDNIERVMMAQPGIPPMELPLIGLDRESRRGQQKQIEEAVNRLKVSAQGSEVVTGPAGTFQARHTRIDPPDEAEGMQRTEFWTDARKVGALGLVAWQRGTARYELASQGKGAKSDLVPFPNRAPASVDPAKVQRKVSGPGIEEKPAQK